MIRYYNQKQVLLFCLLSAIIAVFLVIKLDPSSFRKAKTQAKLNNSSQSLVVHQAVQSASNAQVNNPDQAIEDLTEQNSIAIYKEHNESVVYISTEVTLYSWFYEAVPQSGGTASGFIINQDGYIVTNYHVVAQANKVFVSLATGEQLDGEVIGIDKENDIALIKVEAPKYLQLKPLVLGHSEDLQVGQKVYAIGNPFVFQRTFTSGIISGLGRPLRGAGGAIIQNMIQTDASINPGNSGGPLLNRYGQVIGMTTMIYSPTGGSIGIGFAVPVDTITRVISDLMTYGTVNRGILDIKPIFITPSLARYAKLDVDEGLLVSEVVRGGKAEKAGLRGGVRKQAILVSGQVVYLGGDIITKINNTPIKAPSDYYTALESTKPGEIVELELIQNHVKISLKVELVPREDADQA